MRNLLLATALLATPLIAQTAPPADPAPPATEQAPPADATTAAPAEPAATMAPAPAATPGVVFQQPPSVEQAFPPPAPKADYPWCTKTVTDGCKQRRDPK